MTNKKLENYQACMILHAVGDTIGYNNNYYEFFNGGILSFNNAIEKFYDFLSHGGINHFSLENRTVSDDTLLHIDVANSLLIDDPTINNIGDDLSKRFVITYKKHFENKENERDPGLSILKNLKRLANGGKWNTTPYDFYDGGSGASMRSSCIGLIYWNNFDMLLKVSLETSMITHNSTTGYLGGFTSAFFTSCAINKIPIEQWASKLIEIFDKEIILNYLKANGTNDDIQNYKKDHKYFLSKWQLYIDDKFKDGDPIKRKSFTNLVFRSKYYNDNISSIGLDSETKGELKFIGSVGDDSVIIAYDCLLDARDNWEKLVIYSMLHMGDTDTTGCIAGSWYGALYGFHDVPKHYIDQVEFSDSLHKIGKNLFDKS